MTTIDAVYRDGVLHPSAPLPLADGTAVRLAVLPEPAPPPDPLDPADVLARIRAIAALSDPNRPVENVSGNVDHYLYGQPGDAGDVR